MPAMATVYVYGYVLLLSFVWMQSTTADKRSRDLACLSADADPPSQEIYSKCCFASTVGEPFIQSSVKAQCDIHDAAKTTDHPYKGSKDVIRMAVPDQGTKWFCPLASYKPHEYTDPGVVAKMRAGKGPEPDWQGVAKLISSGEMKWNERVGRHNKESLECEYKLDAAYHNMPLNPWGRTGLKGRGLLYNWGPNHAADPVVTRWKTYRSALGLGPYKFVKKVQDASGKPKRVLEFVAIVRGDKEAGVTEWAFPGGMLDPGEDAITTARREFTEEALNSADKSEQEKKAFDYFMDARGRYSVLLWSGYVDDPRNTDNAWMETRAYNFHEPALNHKMTKGLLKLQAGDDAKHVEWVEVTNDIQMYANHKVWLMEARQHQWNMVEKYEKKRKPQSSARFVEYEEYYNNEYEEDEAYENNEDYDGYDDYEDYEELEDQYYAHKAASHARKHNSSGLAVDASVVLGTVMAVLLALCVLGCVLVVTCGTGAGLGYVIAQKKDTFLARNQC